MDAVKSASLSENKWHELATTLQGANEAAVLTEALSNGLVHAIHASEPAIKPTAARRIGTAIVSEAKRHGLDPFLLAAVAKVESRFDPYATSPAGARGLMQLLPATGRAVAKEAGAPLRADAELYDLEVSTRLGARYLADLMHTFGTTEAALLAYHRGPENARRLLGMELAGEALGGYPRSVLAVRDGLLRRARAAKPE
jgi:soluble lytic murein transglycosylase-like protein